MRGRAGDVAFYGLLMCVAAAAVVLSILPLHHRSPSTGAITYPVAPSARSTSTQTDRAATDAKGAAGARAAKARAARAAPLTTITATRGPSWVVVRDRSAVGPVLYRGILEQGHRIRLRRPPVWAQVGAAQNVDVRVSGRRIPLGGAALTGVVLTAQGALPAQQGAPGIIGS